jgi:ABC-2 type transport system permease protein
MFRTIKQMGAVAKVAARSNLAYPGEVLGRTAFLGVILYIFLKLWQATYSQTGEERLGGLTLVQMLWYLTFAEAMYMSTPRLAQQVDEDVRSGSLAVRLLKPMSYPLYCLSSMLGERIVRFLFNLAIGSLIALVLVGPVSFSPAGFSLAGLSMVALAVLFSFLLGGIGHLIVGLGAFWLEDTSGLLLIYFRLSMILGGMILPLELFPDWLRQIVVFLPFPYLIYGPVHLALHPDGSEFAGLALRQLACLFVMSVVAAFIYRRALGRISAHGG